MHAFAICSAATAHISAATPAAHSSRRALRAVVPGVIAGALLMGAQAQAAFDVTIAASGSSSGGAWSGDTWTASASGARVLASEVKTHLGNGPTTIRTGSGGSEFGDLYVDGDITWSANALTLRAAHDVIVNGALVGSGTATFVVEYGQGAVATGNTAVYRFNTPVKLTSYSGDPYVTPNYSTKRGSDGVLKSRAVPACSSSRGSSYCPFLKSTAAFAADGVPEVFNIEYRTLEVNGPADAVLWPYFNMSSQFAAGYYTYVMSCVEGVGKFYYTSGTQQAAYFGAGGVITDLANLEKYTTTTRTCKEFNNGPIISTGSSAGFPNGYMFKYVPDTGAYGNAEHVLGMIITGAEVANVSYTVLDLIVNVRPHAPTAAGAADLELTAPSGEGTTDVTVTGSGDLVLRATSSNTTLLPNANITGADGCTAAANCALAVTAAAGQYGTATVTVTAEDFWGQRGSDDFVVTVLPPVPTIAGTAGVRMGVSTSGSKEVTLTGTDALTVTTMSSNTTLLPDGNIGAASCTAAGACTLTLTPAAGQIGRAEVAVAVTDTWGRQDTARFTVDVLATARVAYNGNGQTAGTPPADNGTYLAGDEVIVLDSALERTGYTFTGWNTRTDGRGAHFDANERFAIKGDTTLYAEWESETTTVSLGGGGAFSFVWLGALLLLFAARLPRNYRFQP